MKCDYSRFCNCCIDGYCDGVIPSCTMCKHVSCNYDSMPCRACSALSSSTQCKFELAEGFTEPIDTGLEKIQVKSNEN